MLTRFVAMVFGCRHKNYSFPITIRPKRRTGSTSPGGAYVVCFDCSRELAYDWINMRIAPQPTRVLPPRADAMDLVLRDLAS